jgi:lipoprotein NlpD
MSAFTRQYYYVFCILLCIVFLSSCSTRNTPAPVVGIYGSVPLKDRIKNSITSDAYVVKKGETLFSIAWRANSDVRQIAQLNRISSPYKIFPGQKLFLTKKEYKKAANTSKNKHSTKANSTNNKSINKKSSKKVLASSKKQAYGENVTGGKIYQKSSSTTKEFSQKIRWWQWPVNGKIIERFSNKVQGNKGVDIAGSRGTSIRATASGKVVYAGEALRGYGKLVIIKHNDDYLSAYAHNDKILVKEQEQINRGSIIAKMGDTDSSKVMLHFEIRFRGKSVDPLKYLPKK